MGVISESCFFMQDNYGHMASYVVHIAKFLVHTLFWLYRSICTGYTGQTPRPSTNLLPGGLFLCDLCRCRRVPVFPRMLIHHHHHHSHKQDELILGPESSKSCPLCLLVENWRSLVTWSTKIFYNEWYSLAKVIYLNSQVYNRALKIFPFTLFYLGGAFQDLF